MKALVSVIIATILLPSLILAQSIKVEALRPQFEFSNAEPSTLTSAWFITVAVPVYKRINLVGQLPFAFGKLEDSQVPTKDETIGNPGIGLRFDHERLTIDVAVRVPLAKNGFAGFVGALADIDRQEAFIPDLVPIIAMIKTKVNVARLSISPYGGASLNYKYDHKDKYNFFQSVFKNKENDGELYVLYGAEGWLQVVGPFHLGATFNGRTWVTSGGTFSNSSIHQLGVRAKLVFAKFEPGLLFRLPLDDILLDYLIGVDFNLAL